MSSCLLFYYITITNKKASVQTCLFVFEFRVIFEVFFRLKESIAGFGLCIHRVAGKRYGEPAHEV